MSHWKKKITQFSLAGKGSLVYKSGRQSPKIGYVGPMAWKNGELTEVMLPFTGVAIYARRFFDYSIFEILVEAKRYNARTQNISLQATRFNGSVQVA